MLVLGRFAAFGDRDTLFTNTLARQGLETFWGSVLILVGGAIVLTSYFRHRGLTVLMHGVTAFVMIWTWYIAAVIGGVHTPTVELALGLGLFLAAATLAEALESVNIRRCRGSRAA